MDKERSAPETRSPTRFNEASEKRGSLPETRSPTSFNEASTRFNGASTEKRDSVSETRTPSRISTTSADSRSPLPESRSPTSFYKDNQKMPLQSDKTPPKQWETMGNYSRSRFDGDVKPPSSSSFGVKDSPDTREQKRDIPSSPTRLERQQAVEEPLRKYETSSRVENKVESEMRRAFPLNDKLVISNTPTLTLSEKRWNQSQCLLLVTRTTKYSGMRTILCHHHPRCIFWTRWKPHRTAYPCPPLLVKSLLNFRPHIMTITPKVIPHKESLLQSVATL